MRNMRLLTIGSAFLVTCLGISCSCERQEQTQKQGSMKITMSSPATVSGSYGPSESPSAAAEVYVENVTIETDTFTCTADTAQFNRETGQLVLTGNVLIRTDDDIEFSAEKVVLKGKPNGSDN